MAEGVLRHLAQERGLDWSFDSAGTADYHTGEPPDPRAIATLKSKGIDISGLRARQFRTADFDRFDYILAMDASNYNNILRMARHDADRAKVRLIRNFNLPGSNAQVPDPYYGGLDGFEEVYQMLCEAGAALLAELGE